MKSKISPLKEYDKTNGLKFKFWSSTPNDGIWSLDGVVYNEGQDFRTCEKYAEYKAAGFNMAHLGNTVLAHQLEIGKPEPITKEQFLEKNLKALQALNEVGFDEIDISDYRFTNILSRKVGGLIGEGKLFATEKDLDAFIEECVSWYRDLPGINSICIGDEPTWWGLESFGQVFKSVGRVCPDKKRFYNFFTGIDNEDATGPIIPKEGQTRFDAAKEQYARYINTALDCMGEGVDHICFDDYPILTDHVSETFIPVLQILADIAKERGIALHAWTQTFEMLHFGAVHYRKVEKADAYWLNNLLLGFGVKAIGYYLYVSCNENMTKGENYIDGSSFVTRKHEKTDVYDFMQQIMKEDQEFAPVILNFDYQGSKSFTWQYCYLDKQQIKLVDNSYEFKKLVGIEFHQGCQGCLMATELYDKKKNNYMYMIMNALDPALNPAITSQEFTVTFDNEYENAAVYFCGEGKDVKLANHSLCVTLKAGEAVFIIPY